MDILQTILLSLVEGITEFLPISSTGHLVLTSKLLNIPQTDFIKTFEIFIQLGAILAVVVLYYKTLLSNFNLWLKIIAAFIPTGILGLIFFKVIKDYLIGNIPVTLSSLFLGGVSLILVEIFYHPKEQTKDLKDLSFIQAFVIGLFQSISMIPGVSRAAATIFGGLFLGLDRKKAAEFSFFLAIPTMAAASSLDLIKTKLTFNQDEYLLLGFGFLGAFLSALVCVKYFIKYLQNHNFIWFGVYRIILAVLFWLVVV